MRPNRASAAVCVLVNVVIFVVVFSEDNEGITAAIGTNAISRVRIWDAERPNIFTLRICKDVAVRRVNQIAIRPRRPMRARLRRHTLRQRARREFILPHTGAERRGRVVHGNGQARIVKRATVGTPRLMGQTCGNGEVERISDRKARIRFVGLSTFGILKKCNVVMLFIAS